MSILTLPALVVNPNRDRYGLRAPRGGCRVQGRFYRGGSFCPSYDASNPLELPSVELGGVSYLIESVEPGNTASAVRLIKRVTGEQHLVERHADGHASCDCLGYRYRESCKHLAAAPTLPVPSLDVDDLTAIIVAPESTRLGHVEEAIRNVVTHLLETEVRLGLAARVTWGRMSEDRRQDFAEWITANGIVIDPFGDRPTDPSERWEWFCLECRDGATVEFPEPEAPCPDPSPEFVPSLEDELEAAALLWEDETEDPAYHAWLDDLARERECEAFAFAGPSEADGYPAGYCS